MKYFKHMSNMSADPRVKRVRRLYGLEGYGLYCLVLEYISSQLDPQSPIPDLQETAEDIADEWKVDVNRVSEMLNFMVDEGLLSLDVNSGRVVCLKVEKYLDEYMKKAPGFREALEDWKQDQLEDFDTESDNIRQTPDSVGQNPQHDGFCPSRIEENRIEETSPTDSIQPSKKRRRADTQHPTLHVPIERARYDKLVEEHGEDRVDAAIQSRLDWEALKGREPAKEYAAAAANWLRNARKFGDISDDDELNPHTVAPEYLDLHRRTGT